MLKFMGANTNLSPLHAKELLEVHYFLFVLIYALNMILFNSHLCMAHNVMYRLNLFFVTNIFQDEKVGFAYVSQREARPSLYEI